MPKKPAVFLDRDNTIIHNDGDLGDPAQLRLIQGAAMAIASLCGLGFPVVVVTNQGGVARGKYTEDDVDAVHDRLREMVEASANGARIEAFYFCPYHPAGNVAEYTAEHPNRKPAPGMLLQAADDLGLDLERSWMIGDQLRDVQAGAAAGCRTVLLREDAHRLTPLEMDRLAESSNVQTRPRDGDTPAKPDFMARSLVEAVRIIASQRHARDEAAPGVAMVGSRFDAEMMTKLQTPRAGNAPAAPPPRPTKPFRPLALPEPEEADPAVPRESPKQRIAKVIERARKSIPAAVPGETPEAAASTGASTSPPEAPPPEVSPFTSRAEEPLPGGDQAPDPPPCAPEHRPVSPASSPPPAPPAPGAAAAGSVAAPAVAPAAVSTSAPPVIPPEKRVPPQHDPAPSSADHSPAADDLAAPTAQKTLRMILQELRGQRGLADESSPAMLVAMVTQALAVVCLLGGLWMGAGSDGLFLRWLGTALIAQGATIALLLFGRAGR